MKTDYDKMEDRSLNLGGSIPLRQEDIIAAYRSQDRDARLLGEYWALNLRIRGLEHVLKLKKKQKEGKTFSPEPLMIMQIKAMKKYANALAIRLDYEQGGRANPEVIARIKAMHPTIQATIVGSGEYAKEWHAGPREIAEFEAKVRREADEPKPIGLDDVREALDKKEAGAPDAECEYTLIYALPDPTPVPIEDAVKKEE